MLRNKVLQTLKRVTDDWHQRTEQIGYGQELRSDTFTPNMYIDLIQKNHFLYQQLETQFEASSLFQLPVFHSFYKTRRATLREDLTAIGVEPIVFEVPTPFHLSAVPEGIGFLYVLEGANLGRQLIYKMLSNNPALATYQPFHFYEEKDAPKRWQRFADLAAAHISIPAQQQTANRTAIAVFQFFHEVYAQKKAA